MLLICIGGCLPDPLSVSLSLCVSVISKLDYDDWIFNLRNTQMAKEIERYQKLGLRESLHRIYRYPSACNELSFLLRGVYSKVPKNLQSLIFQDTLSAFRLLPQYASILSTSLPLKYVDMFQSVVVGANANFLWVINFYKQILENDLYTRLWIQKVLCLCNLNL